MGRKIPGKKHRGVKDPYSQHAKRLDSIKTKINKTPTNPDDQPIPKTLIRLMDWKNKANKKNKKDKDKTGISAQSAKIIKRKDLLKAKHSNPVNKLKKLKGESNKSFNVRINDAMKNLMDEKGFDDIINDLPQEKEKPQKNDDEPSVYIQKKGRKRRRLIKGEPVLSKSQKKTIKEKSKKEQYKQEKELDKQYLIQRDVVQFGEIVHEPPNLINPRKAEQTNYAPRPARKDLLLNKLFESNSYSKPSEKIAKPNIMVNQKKNEGVLNLKGKRRDLPNNVRRKLEQTQNEAIEAYKLLKLERQTEKNNLNA